MSRQRQTHRNIPLLNAGPHAAFQGFNLKEATDCTHISCQSCGRLIYALHAIRRLCICNPTLHMLHNIPKKTMSET
uniref:Uncharacterized protein n=1 Tax=Anguilla anguilla TaxID=7936 RepID=A0A0E9X998_ANGAN